VALSPLGAHGRPQRSLPDETRAPKLIMAGWLDDSAAAQADEVFRRSIGWTLLDSTPVSEQGTELLDSSWGKQVREQILGFLLDYP
jgi:hypothetical protein